MSEADLLDQLIGKRGLMPTLHWHTAHFRPARTARTYFDKKGQEQTVWVTAVSGDGEGFPDIVAVRETRTLFAELKGRNRELTPEQRIWLDLLDDAGNEVYLWLESDWEEICEILTLGHPPNLIEKAELKTAWRAKRHGNKNISPF